MDLLAALREQQIFLPSACGGRGTCAYCKCKVEEGAGPLLPTESPLLTKEEIESGMRLACQVKIRQDIALEIPRELLAIKEFTTRCAEIIDLTYDTKQFTFEVMDSGAIDYVPGQYLQLLTPIYPGSTAEVYRAYSISSNPVDKRKIELIIRRVPSGVCTTYCFDFLKVGDEVKLNGPYGEFYLRDTDAPIIFVAGGSGMAPIRCILHNMANTGNKRKATYFFGGNTHKDMYLLEEMFEFEKKLNFTFVPVISRPDEGVDWKGEKGLVTEALARVMKDAKGHEAYLCGSPGMIDASIKVLKDLGVSENKIYFDKFA